MRVTQTLYKFYSFKLRSKNSTCYFHDLLFKSAEFMEEFQISTLRCIHSSASTPLNRDLTYFKLKLSFNIIKADDLKYIFYCEYPYIPECLIVICGIYDLQSLWESRSR